MPAKLMTLYDYTIELVGEYPVITVTQLKSSKVITFPMQCTKNLTGLHNHMCSLTDTQCESWFK